MLVTKGLYICLPYSTYFSEVIGLGLKCLALKVDRLYANEKVRQG